MNLVSLIISKETADLPPLITPRNGNHNGNGNGIAPANRLTASPFQIDHRGEVIAELRHDADILDREAEAILAAAEKQAAARTVRAVHLRLSADHLEAHPPE